MAMEQPDGSSVDVRVFGDEFYVRVEGLDGMTLVRDAGGWISYATLNADSSALVSTGLRYNSAGLAARSAAVPALPQGLDIKRASRAERRNGVARELGIDMPGLGLGKFAAQAVPLTDEVAASAETGPDSVKKVLGLFLLVEFPDSRATFSKAALDSLGNVKGYNKFSNFGSVSDYFSDISHGKYEYSLLVSDYYLAKNNKAYYDRAGGYEGGQELIKEALAGLEAKGFDYSSLTTTGTNKTVVAINVLYAGAFGKTWGQGIWPHRGNISAVTYDGARLSGYQMTGITSSLSIGTIVHENGHLLFNWPDLYDYDGDSRGVGSFCVMSGQSSKNPQPPNPYFRSGQGWDTLVDMKTLTNGLVQVPNNWSKAYKWTNPANASEMFVIENVIKKGRWAALPDEGLVIWHIDTKGNNSWQDMTASRHFRVSVEQADGKFDLEKNVNGGGANDLYHSGNKDLFNATTTPNSKWWDGAVSGLDINAISVVKDTMTFRITGKPVSAGPGPGPAPLEPFRASLAGRRLVLEIRDAGAYAVTAMTAEGRLFRLREGFLAAGAHGVDLSALHQGAYGIEVRGPSARRAYRQVLLR